MYINIYDNSNALLRNSENEDIFYQCVIIYHGFEFIYTYIYTSAVTQLVILICYTFLMKKYERIFLG